jgi:hypothetical protein
MGPHLKEHKMIRGFASLVYFFHVVLESFHQEVKRVCKLVSYLTKVHQDFDGILKNLLDVLFLLEKRLAI